MVATQGLDLQTRANRCNSKFHDFRICQYLKMKAYNIIMGKLKIYEYNSPSKGGLTAPLENEQWRIMPFWPLA